MRHARALNGQGDHKVSLDQVTQAMYETGRAIQARYKRRLSPAPPSMWLRVRAEEPKSRRISLARCGTARRKLASVVRELVRIRISQRTLSRRKPLTENRGSIKSAIAVSQPLSRQISRPPETNQGSLSAHPKTAYIGYPTLASPHTSPGHSVSARATCRPCPRTVS